MFVHRAFPSTSLIKLVAALPPPPPHPHPVTTPPGPSPDAWRCHSDTDWLILFFKYVLLFFII